MPSATEPQSLAPKKTAVSNIQLIPWDPESGDHVQRLIQQRIACGWNEEMVEPDWREQQRLGHKSIHWVVRSPHFLVPSSLITIPRSFRTQIHQKQHLKKSTYPHFHLKVPLCRTRLLELGENPVSRLISRPSSPSVTSRLTPKKRTYQTESMS